MREALFLSQAMYGRDSARFLPLLTPSFSVTLTHAAR